MTERRACRRRRRPANKLLPLASSTTDMWRCIELPACSAIGLAMKVACMPYSLRRLARQALEQHDLVGQPQRIAVQEIDLQLAGTGFMGQRFERQRRR